MCNFLSWLPRSTSAGTGRPTWRCTSAGWSWSSLGWGVGWSPRKLDRFFTCLPQKKGYSGWAQRSLCIVWHAEPSLVWLRAQFRGSVALLWQRRRLRAQGGHWHCAGAWNGEIYVRDRLWKITLKLRWSPWSRWSRWQTACQELVGS